MKSKRGRPKKEPVVETPQVDSVIVVQSKREKRLLEPPLSQRRVIKDSYRQKQEDVHFNMGFMPGNSYRCKSCRSGFALIQGTDVVCPNCKSTDLVPHSTDILA